MSGLTADTARTRRTRTRTPATGVLLLGVLLAAPPSASAEVAPPAFSVGLTVMRTYFDESEWCVLGCSKLDIDDDTDAGVELFIKARWSALWTWKLGYADQGGFDFVDRFDRDVGGTVEVSLGYLAWAPEWDLTEAFSLTGAIGLGRQDVDVDVNAGEVEIDDGWASYSTLGAQYRVSRHVALHAEAGYSFGDDIDVGWLGIGGSYTF